MCRHRLKLALHAFKPVVKQSASHVLQRPIHPPIQFDLVVQPPQHPSNRPLLRERGEGDPHPALIGETDVVRHVGLAFDSVRLLPKLFAVHPIEQEAGVDDARIERAPVAKLRREHEAGCFAQYIRESADGALRGEHHVTRAADLVSDLVQIGFGEAVSVVEKETAVDVAGASEWNSVRRQLDVLRAVSVADRENARVDQVLNPEGSDKGFAR